MKRTRTILYAGTYERDYPRNQQMIRLLRRCGCDVREIHQPVWERFRDKSSGLGGWEGAVRTGLSLLTAYTSLWFKILFCLRGVDAVVIGYIGQLDMLVLGPLARLTRKPLIFNPLVTLTDTMVEDRAIVGSKSLAARTIWLLDWVALHLATLIVVDTPENGDYLIRQFGVSGDRIGEIDVGADEEVFRGPSDVTAAHVQRDALHVLFYGKMIPLHGIETILAAVRLLESEPDINFEIIGSGQLERQVATFCADHPDARVTHRLWVAYSRLPQRIAIADCTLGIFGSGEKAARVVPNKVFQAMAMGAPIITRDSPAIRRVLSDGESALLVPPGRPEALADAIRHLRDPELRGRLGRSARQAYERYGSDTALSHRLGDLLDQFVPADGQANCADRRR